MSDLRQDLKVLKAGPITNVDETRYTYQLPILLYI